MQYFYDGQFKTLLGQFCRIFDKFSYMTGENGSGKKELLPVPCKPGNTSKMVYLISRKNSENIALTAPFISCWIENISVNRSRTVNPTHVDQLIINEQNFDYSRNAYDGTQSKSDKYIVERLAPVPYDITMSVDIWTTNEDMKLQILEQILVLFNPAIDFQTNENGLDWTSLKSVELTDISYSSRSVPVGDDNAMEVTSLKFQVQHFFLNAPAKVKKQGLINSIVQNVGFDKNTPDGIVTWESGDFFPTVVTVDNLSIEVTGSEIRLYKVGKPEDNGVPWPELFTKMGMQFQPGVYSLRLQSDLDVRYSTADIIISLDSISTVRPEIATGTLNVNSLPDTSLNAVKNVINPWIYYPDNPRPEYEIDNEIGSRFIITKNITSGTEAWGALEARSGSIIQTDDGVNWYVDHDSNAEDFEEGSIVYVTETEDYLYQANRDNWIDVYQGNYKPGWWRLVSITNKNVGV